MKLRQLARTFLKVGKIINIILIPLFALLFVIILIVNIVALVAANNSGDSATIGLAVGNLVSGIITWLILIACVVVAFILNQKASQITENAKSKAEAKPGAIMAIVAGALVTTFPIASGVLLLCTKEEDWNQPLEQPQPAQVEEKPAEEPKAE